MKANSIIFIAFGFLQVPLLISSFLFPVATSDIKYYLHTKNIKNEELSPDNPEIPNPKAPLILITHGWKASAEDKWIKKLTEAFLEKGDYNVITVDWSRVSNRLYVIVSLEFSTVADFVAKFLVNLAEKRKVNLYTSHLIGHSMGAHLLGYSARKLSLKHTIGRITGLDPSGLQFNLVHGLDSGDARLVVSLHTSMILGSLWKNGDINFYANGGRGPQPGCAIFKLFCSHNRSTWLFVEAGKNEKAFLASTCNDSFFGTTKNIRNVTLGGDLTLNDAGSYCFSTLGSPPYTMN